MHAPESNACAGAVIIEERKIGQKRIGAALATDALLAAAGRADEIDLVDHHASRVREPVEGADRLLFQERSFRGRGARNVANLTCADLSRNLRIGFHGAPRKGDSEAGSGKQCHFRRFAVCSDLTENQLGGVNMAPSTLWMRPCRGLVSLSRLGRSAPSFL